MQKIFKTFCFCVLFTTTSFSQLVINEIMYNPPEAGDDSLEYIEVINATNSSINLSGYKIADGVSFNMPNINLGAGQILLVAKDSVAIQIVFNKTAYQWVSSGSLNNSGELITIRNNVNDIIDAVTYADASPWAAEADGFGSSLELCDPGLDNNVGDNWRAGTTPTGKIINNIEIKATPGTANSSICIVEPDLYVDVKNFEFTPKDITINVGETVRWSNKGGQHNVNGSKTKFPSNPESFSNGPTSSSAWTYDFTFKIAGLYNYQCDAHPGDMRGTITVLPAANPYPKYNIATVTTTSAEGVADSAGVKCEVEGIVYGTNLRPTGLQFTIIDGQNNGLAVFNTGLNFGYTVTEGDLISIKGKLEQFNGLTQIVPDSIKLLSSGNALINPKEITSFVENDESSLLSINNLTYVDVSQWTGTGAGFNVEMTDGNNDYQIRIDADNELYSMSAPTAPLKVTGILGQFDNTSPFDGGYQLLPRYAADMTTISSTEETNDLNKIVVSPNPFIDNITIASVNTIQKIKLYDGNGRFILTCDHGTIDMGSFRSGMYFLRIMTNKGMTTTKIVKL